MSTAAIEFDSAFQALTNHPPLRWQRRLFNQLRAGQIPSVCDLPTGLGKTSVIPIWVLALGQQARDGSVNLPRRLVYIVNRRTVVDQATSVVEQLHQRLLAPDDARWSAHAETLRGLAVALQGLASTTDGVLAVSTLRGEFADNEEWKADPARAAIVLGTIDMVGSKLLFNGYGDGRYWRAQHAGLIGQDALMIHDEAHLTPAFSDLLRQVADAQRQAGDPRPVQVMELSATLRARNEHRLDPEQQDEEDAVHPLKLEPQDEQDDIVRERLGAIKRLRLHQIGASSQANHGDGVKEACRKLAELSLNHQDEWAKVLIYVRSPEHAQYVFDLLSKQLGNELAGNIALLTGTLRGRERDKLVQESRVYRAFLEPGQQVDRTVYLVSTSAGEVGIDLDADHAVCGETTLDSLIQQLGRVNRRGGCGRKACVDVVVRTGGQGTKQDLSGVDAAVKATAKILVEWADSSNGVIDVSPRNLRALVAQLGDERREKAFAPKPPVPLLTDMLLDAWSLTTIDGHMPGRPEVAAYLHGLTNDPPEAYVVWRKEVALLHGAGVDRDALGDWFRACGVEARERLRDRTDRVRTTLGALQERHRREDEGRDLPVVLLGERGEVEWSSLSQIVNKQFDLAFRTVVLPVEAGGLDEHGMLHAPSSAADIDVGDQDQPGERRERWIHVEHQDGSRYERLTTGGAAEVLPAGLRERERVLLQQPPEGAEADGSSCFLILLVEPKKAAVEHAESARTEQTLSFHLDRTAGAMNRISEALHVAHPLREALEIAARGHDRGKDHPVWQRYACNPDLHAPVAKSTKYLNGRALGGYRHEFGSLLAAAADEQIRAHPESDLILHLIAGHHGWARPHFERNAGHSNHTTAENEEVAAETMRRFGRLQRRFGRWGLAWLESLVRCADISASMPHAAATAGAAHSEAAP